MVLLPRLATLNGKNVSTTATHLRYVYTENLRTRVGIRPQLLPPPPPPRTSPGDQSSL